MGSYLLAVSISKGKTTLHAGWNVCVIPVEGSTLLGEAAGLFVRGSRAESSVVVETWCSEVAADRRALGNRAASVTIAISNSPSATTIHNHCLVLV
jgi:hypothetical protein